MQEYFGRVDNNHTVGGRIEYGAGIEENGAFAVAEPHGRVSAVVEATGEQHLSAFDKHTVARKHLLPQADNAVEAGGAQAGPVGVLGQSQFVAYQVHHLVVHQHGENAFELATVLVLQAVLLEYGIDRRSRALASFAVQSLKGRNAECFLAQVVDKTVCES